jgi:predicted  nucleic acid-binding Zn-ribbon protein
MKMKFKILFSIMCVIAIVGIAGTVVFKSQDDSNLKLLNTSNQQLASTQTALKNEQATLEQTQATLATANSQISTDKTTLANDQRTLASAQTQLTNTQTQLTNTQNQLTSTSSQLSNANSQISSDSDQITTLNGQLSSDTTQLNFFNQTYQYQLKFGVQPPYQEPAIVNGLESTANINLVSNPNAKDPTFSQLESFLLADTNIDQAYTVGMVECTNYAETVYNDCEAAGIKAYFVVLWFSDITDGHALNAFQTTDRGLVFADCTSGDAYADTYAPYADFVRVGYIEVGKEYQSLSFTSVGSSPDATSYQWIVNYGATHPTFNGMVSAEVGNAEAIESEIENWNNSPALIAYNNAVTSLEAQITQYNSEVSAYNANPSAYSQSYYQSLVSQGNQLTIEQNNLNNEYNQLEAQYQALVNSYNNAEQTISTLNNRIATEGVYTYVPNTDIVKSVEIYQP